MSPGKFVKDVIKASVIRLIQPIYFAAARDVTPLAANGPVLVIAPHADDETLGCGAFIARARSLGQRVRIVIVTDGKNAVTPGITSEQLAVIRREEGIKAGAVLGVGADDVVFCELPDCDASSHAGLIDQHLTREISALRPNVILSPYGIDKHPDHRAVAASVDRLYRNGTIMCPVFEYPIWFWPEGAFQELFAGRFGAFRRMDARPFVAQKKAAMLAHASQYPYPDEPERDAGFFSPLSFEAQYFTSGELYFEKPPVRKSA